MADNIEQLQQRAARFLKQRNPEDTGLEGAFAIPQQRPRFSVFLPEHAERSFELTSQFMALAHENPGPEGLESVLHAAENASVTDDIDLVKHALMVFITHSPEGSRLPIPSLQEREPEKLLPSHPPATGEEAVLGGVVLEGAIGTEAQLDWFREDPWANSHHEHWHVVYPNRGIPNAAGMPTLKDRQGELFFYMHQQMLARYDTERLAVGMFPAQPFADYRQSIPQGYIANLPGFADRPPGLTLGDLGSGPNSYPVSEHERIRDAVLDATATGVFRRPNNTTVPVDIDLLGTVEESSVGSNLQNLAGRYSSHHNLGHGLIAFITDPTNQSEAGVMIDTATAIRDPIFFRWHRHVDDMAFRWQETQAPNDFTDAPPVRVRKSDNSSATQPESPDIILCFKDSIPGADDPNLDGHAFGEQEFGGENWNTDFGSGSLTTDTLETMMLQQQIGSGAQAFTVSYLDQREYFYFIRAKNSSTEARDVTVRIFLVASEVADNRRMWIEMDKFKHTLPAGGDDESAGTVIFRPAALSSVIRKPGVKPPAPIQRSGTDPDENYCECGWPYNLLVPRGTPEGMNFHLMVMITDWQLDQVGEDTACGSMSFCGAKDRYPDTRAMGYPFDRPFANGSIADFIAAQDNVAARQITIRLV